MLSNLNKNKEDYLFNDFYSFLSKKRLDFKDTLSVFRSLSVTSIYASFKTKFRIGRRSIQKAFL